MTWGSDLVELFKQQGEYSPEDALLSTDTQSTLVDTLQLSGEPQANATDVRTYSPSRTFLVDSICIIATATL